MTVKLHHTAQFYRHRPSYFGIGPWSMVHRHRMLRRPITKHRRYVRPI